MKEPSFQQRAATTRWNAQCLTSGVLRITTIKTDKVLLRIEGRLVGPWVKELEKTVSRAEALSLPLEIDVWDLTYSDSAGERALVRLHKKGACFKGKGPFAEYLFRQLRIPLLSRQAPSSDDKHDERNFQVRTEK